MTDDSRPYASWSDDEILRGRERGVRGPNLKRVPKGLHDEAMFRLLAKGRELFADNFEAAVEVIIGIALDESAENAIRLKAAQYVVERIAGKTPDRVEISAGDKPFEILLQGISRDLAEPAEPLVIEAEILEQPEPTQEEALARMKRRRKGLAHRRRLAEAHRDWNEGD